MREKLYPRLEGRGAHTVSLCLVLAIAFASSGGGAGAGAGAPRRLIDGSFAQSVPKALRGQRGPLVMTRLRISRARKLSKRVASCVPGDLVPGGRLVVERIGVNGRDITFLGLH